MQTIVKKQFVRIDGEPAGAGPAAERRRGAIQCEKSARLLQVEGAVRAIEVTCSCGEITVIELEYPQP